MTTAPPESWPAPTEDERTLALLVHVLGIFSGFLAPLVFYVLKRNSRFVAFHSLQALLWHAAYGAILLVGMFIIFMLMFSTILAHPHSAPGDGPPLAFFGLFGLVWLCGIGGWAVNMILGIVLGIKANHGEWARYPVIGNFVLQKILPEQPIS